MKHCLIPFLFWSLLLMSCDPCAECGEPLKQEPGITTKFINQDSLIVLQDSVLVITDSTTANTAFNKISNDSIRVLEDSIDVMTALGDEAFTARILEFENIVIKLNEDNTTRNAINVALNNSKTKINATIADIKSGSVLINQVNIMETGASIQYEDSLKSYLLPLLYNQSTTTTYQIIIGDREIDLIATYELYESIGNDRLLKIYATNLQVTSSDSVYLNCLTSDCNNDEATLTLYF